LSGRAFIRYSTRCNRIASLKRPIMLATADIHTQAACVDFLLSILESLYSPVELAHNLRNPMLHGASTLDDGSLANCIAYSLSILKLWELKSPDAVRAVLDAIRTEDLAVNKGDNLFIEWASRWQTGHAADPYSTIANYTTCFRALYTPDNYYIALFNAWNKGETRTQFFNDYGLHSARCRRIGSLGGTTNPAIAVMGEDDLDGKGSIRGESAVEFITSMPNKWREQRKLIAAEQTRLGESDEWGALAFTEWVVTDAMLALRPVYLLRGLGRVSYQIRPDWHLDEERLVRAASDVYDALSKRVRAFDDILLCEADDLYLSICRERVGKPNNHFKIACTSQAALDVVKALNAGFHPRFPDAVKERMYTNMTLVFDVSQMVASNLAVEAGLAEYESRTGERIDDGDGGSAVASMIGRFNDAIRLHRVEYLMNALPDNSRFKAVDPSSVRSLCSDPINSAEFAEEVRATGIEYDPLLEEDAIDHAGTLVTKRAVVCLERIHRFSKARILTASKRNFDQNIELLGVAYSTDFGNIQRMSLDACGNADATINRQSICEGMGHDGVPTVGSVWEQRSQVLSRIWPDWVKAFDPNGVGADEYLDTIYVPPTLRQFTEFWHENVRRAGECVNEARKVAEAP